MLIPFVGENEKQNEWKKELKVIKTSSSENKFRFYGILSLYVYFSFPNLSFESAVLVSFSWLDFILI